ncbi:MAG TPA: glucokinase [Candidatus Saccharimonadales bacterium]|nr:glucokinase [Candidatus Saccharimonadales bacterium]
MLRIDPKLSVGVDAGGTKVHILDSRSQKLHRFVTANYPDALALFDDYFSKIDARPSHVALAMGGLRDTETGAVEPTNCDWPIFKPKEAEKRYPGTRFTTANDMVAAMAGVLVAKSGDLLVVKSGRAAEKGTKVVVTISTGINTCVAIWDEYSHRRIFMEAEAGHAGFQPRNEAHMHHLTHQQGKFKYPSIETALSGRFGVESWVEHSPEIKGAKELKHSIDLAIENGRPVGAVLLEYATESKGASKAAAHAILENMGSLVANILGDYALVYKATGGIYLVGSVSLALAEYWAKQASFEKSFIRKGTKEHAPWMEGFFSDLPIYLATDPHIAAAGALALAQEQASLSA